MKRENLTLLHRGDESDWCPICLGTVDYCLSDRLDRAECNYTSRCRRCGDRTFMVVADPGEDEGLGQMREWLERHRGYTFDACETLSHWPEADLMLHSHMIDSARCPCCGSPMYLVRQGTILKGRALWLLVCPRCHGKTPRHKDLGHLVLPLAYTEEYRDEGADTALERYKILKTNRQFLGAYTYLGC